MTAKGTRNICEIRRQPRGRVLRVGDGAGSSHDSYKSHVNTEPLLLRAAQVRSLRASGQASPSVHSLALSLCLKTLFNRRVLTNCIECVANDAVTQAQRKLSSLARHLAAAWLSNPSTRHCPRATPDRASANQKHKTAENVTKHTTKRTLISNELQQEDRASPAPPERGNVYVR